MIDRTKKVVRRGDAGWVSPQFLQEKLGLEFVDEKKHGERTEYNFECPICGDGDRGKFHINGSGAFNCFKCGLKGRGLQALIEEMEAQGGPAPILRTLV